MVYTYDFRFTKLVRRIFVKKNRDTRVQNREIRKIQEFIKQNYHGTYLKWAEYSHEGYYGKND